MLPNPIPKTHTQVVLVRCHGTKRKSQVAELRAPAIDAAEFSVFYKVSSNLAVHGVHIIATQFGTYCVVLTLSVRWHM